MSASPAAERAAGRPGPTWYHERGPSWLWAAMGPGACAVIGLWEWATPGPVHVVGLTICGLILGLWGVVHVYALRLHSTVTVTSAGYSHGTQTLPLGEIAEVFLPAALEEAGSPENAAAGREVGPTAAGAPAAWALPGLGAERVAGLRRLHGERGYPWDYAPVVGELSRVPKSKETIVIRGQDGTWRRTWARDPEALIRALLAAKGAESSAADPATLTRQPEQGEY